MRFFPWLAKHYRPRNALTPLCSEVFNVTTVRRLSHPTFYVIRRWYVFGVLVFEHQIGSPT